MSRRASLGWLFSAWVAGFLSVLVFHQGTQALALLLGLTARVPYATHSVAPLGMPQLFVLSFWGGVLAMLLWPLLAPPRRRPARALLLGAAIPTLLAWLFAPDALSLGLSASAGLRTWLAVVLCNAAWGLGTLVFMRLLRQD